MVHKSNPHPTKAHRYHFSLSKYTDTHARAPYSSRQLTHRWQEEKAGQKQGWEDGATYRKERAMRRRECRNARRRGSRRRMWHDSKLDSSSSAALGFEVRCHLMLLMLPLLTQFLNNSASVDRKHSQIRSLRFDWTRLESLALPASRA